MFSFFHVWFSLRFLPFFLLFHVTSIVIYLYKPSEWKEEKNVIRFWLSRKMFFYLRKKMCIFFSANAINAKMLQFKLTEKPYFGGCAPFALQTVKIAVKLKRVRLCGEENSEQCIWKKKYTKKNENENKRVIAEEKREKRRSSASSIINFFFCLDVFSCAHCSCSCCNSD